MKKDNTPKNFKALGKGVFPAKASFLLENPLRKLIKSPKLVAKRLLLNNDHNVLEIGAGSGYYSVEVAQKLKSGSLTLLDIQQEMLDINMQKMKLLGLKNVSATTINAASLPYSSNQFDRIFMVTVLGELNEAALALAEMFRVMRPGALLSVSEQRTDPDFLNLKNVKELAKSTGFIFEKKYGWFWNYTANFTKPKPKEAE